VLQQIIVAAVVLIATLFIARRVWRVIASARASATGGSACASGCGCESDAPTDHRVNARASR
jgi:hypothetical protein